MTRTELLSLAERMASHAHGLEPVDFDGFTPDMKETATLLRKLAELRPVALLVSEKSSGEPDLCFPDEREGYEATSSTRLQFDPLYQLSEVLTDE